MDFITAVKTCLLEKYCCFQGRARRSEFWYYCLFSFVVGLVLGWIPYLGTVLSLALILPNLGVSARRLHDTGRTGWMMLLALLPIIGLILIYFCVQDSEPGENKWGSNPKE